MFFAPLDEHDTESIANLPSSPRHDGNPLIRLTLVALRFAHQPGVYRVYRVMCHPEQGVKGEAARSEQARIWNKPIGASLG